MSLGGRVFLRKACVCLAVDLKHQLFSRIAYCKRDAYLRLMEGVSVLRLSKFLCLIIFQAVALTRGEKKEMRG